ncbi:hypothetical protein BDF20DRAFT_57046 [Mycotypha africana]|uniref:uncharacterized protein n=1 Tax=Mycotypha africana TaxID=64632 RepID=UPI002300E52A|nr:uncharacterized protein BDF20DRAFT_57046 [Mycotypha africana]KAI8991715.1 hypothetical protein BDF20DRAFT_57046 [Mycotypha africana]
MNEGYFLFFFFLLVTILNARTIRVFETFLYNSFPGKLTWIKQLLFTLMKNIPSIMLVLSLTSFSQRDQLCLNKTQVAWLVSRVIDVSVEMVLFLFLRLRIPSNGGSLKKRQFGRDYLMLTACISLLIPNFGIL